MSAFYHKMSVVGNRKGPAGVGSTPEPGPQKGLETVDELSLAEKLRRGECTACTAGWTYHEDEETGEEIASRCKCRRADDDLDAHAYCFERLR